MVAKKLLIIVARVLKCTVSRLAVLGTAHPVTGSNPRQGRLDGTVDCYSPNFRMAQHIFSSQVHKFANVFQHCLKATILYFRNLCFPQLL